MKGNVAFPLISLRLGCFLFLKKGCIQWWYCKYGPCEIYVVLHLDGICKTLSSGRTTSLILNTPVCSRMHAHTLCCMYIGMFSLCVSLSLPYAHTYMQRHKYSLHEHKSAFPPLGHQFGWDMTRTGKKLLLRRITERVYFFNFSRFFSLMQKFAFTLSY